MSLRKEARLILVAVAICGCGGLWWHYSEKGKTQPAATMVDLSGWKSAQVETLKWTTEKRFGRIPNKKWTVDYEYVVDGIRYQGRHVTPSLDALVVGHGDYPIDMIVRLNEIRSVWYDPKAPSRSAVFKSTDTDIGSELREAYAELTVRAKQEGRWP